MSKWVERNLEKIEGVFNTTYHDIIPEDLAKLRPWEFRAWIILYFDL